MADRNRQESGGCVIRNVRVPWEHIAGYENKQLAPRDAYHDFILPPVQLQFAAVHVGVGIGAIETAAEYTRKRISRLIHAPRDQLTQQARGEVAVRKYFLLSRNF